MFEAVSAIGGGIGDVDASASAEVPVPKVRIGESFSSGDISVALVGARIAKPQLKSMFGKGGVGKEPMLNLAFRFANHHDRKVVLFRYNEFLPAIRVRDDVDNQLRNVGYGSDHVVGELRSGSDILPGATVGHSMVFAVPLPKTESVVVTVDLECVGEEGKVEFEIPVAKIEGLGA
ncbi:hypothetical protein [Rosistilla oblonga]|uniref:hypothetical protein n=1 Tax=Rosistilla oblonga TaxID=2527990 RepID=UPI003A972E16